MKRSLFLVWMCCCVAIFANESTAQDSIVITKVWDKAPHNGFPDLYYFKNAFYCTFREAPGHVDRENSGKLRIVRSADMQNWETVALFELKGIDVREARLSTLPDGRLLATVAAGIWRPAGYETLDPYVSFSDKEGNSFSPLEKAEIDPRITRSLDWIWRVTWHKGTGYGIMYQVLGGRSSTAWTAYLLRTQDGKRYDMVSRLELDGNPNESTIRFDNKGKMYILVRREAGDKMGYLATGDYPYTTFNYEKLSWRLGGPNFLFLNKKQLVVGSRLHGTDNPTAGNTTAVFVTDLKGNIQHTVKLPSGGDTGYPGMVIKGKHLWMAYYSGHEGKCNIYLAKIPLKSLQAR